MRNAIVLQMGSTYDTSLKRAERELDEAVAALAKQQAETQALEARIADLKASIALLAKLAGTKVGRKWTWTPEQKAKLAASMKARWAQRKATDSAIGELEKTSVNGLK